MKQLSEQELNQKIAKFLDERMTTHPELAQVKQSEKSHLNFSEVFVSRVKHAITKFSVSNPVGSPTMYQL